MLFILLSLGLILLCAGPLVAVLRLPGRSAPLIALGVLACANIVLVAQVASLLFLLDEAWFWLLAQGVLALLALALWWRTGRPTLPRLTITRAGWRASMRQYPLLWGFGAFVVALYLFALYLTLAMPANEWDTLSYRLARAAYWLQHETLFPWVAYDLRQTTFPINTELLWLWTLIGVPGGQLVGLVGWLTTFAAGTLIIGLARWLGFSRAQAVFALLIWLTLPLTVLQAVSTQNDALTGFFALSSLYFLYVGLARGSRTHTGALILSGVALGLAVGTKTTMLFFLPGYGVVALLLLLVQRRLRPFVLWGMACLMGVLLFGAYIYLQNWAIFGSPLGLSEAVEDMSGPEASRLELLQTNAPRYLAQWFDSTGLPRAPQEDFLGLRWQLLDRVFEPSPFLTGSFASWLKYVPPVHETLAWFGPLGWLVFLPGLAYGVWRAWRRRDMYVLGLVIVPVVFVLAHSAAISWTPFRGRYHVPIVMLAAPLMAWPLLHRGWGVVRWLAVGLAIVIVSNTLLYNALRPLTGERAVWNLTQTERQLLSRDGEFALFFELQALIPEEAALGLALTHEDMTYQFDYLYFGEDLQRHVLPLLAGDSLREMAANGTQFIRVQPPYAETQPVPDYILIHEMLLARVEDTSGYQEIAQGQRLHLFQAVRISQGEG